MSRSRTQDKKEKEKKEKLQVPVLIVRPLDGGIRLHREVAQALEVSKGQMVSVTKDGFSVVGAVEFSDAELNIVQVPKSLRELGAILLGDRVVVAKSTQPPYAQLVKIRGSGAEATIKEELLEIGVVHPGQPFDSFEVVDVEASGLEQATAAMAKLSLSSSSVSPAVIFHPTTQLDFVEETVSRHKYPKLPQRLSFNSVGGLDHAISLLKSTVDLPLHKPELFSDFGISPPRGILLHGPPGTGKTMLLRCVAHSSNAHVLMVNGPLVVSKYLGETENAIRDIFAEAERFQPLIVFMDEIDSLAPRRGLDDAGETELRVVATLLTMMDGMGALGRVVVVGATNRPNAIDPALRRPGRFDQEVEVGIPDVEAREDILTKQFAKMNPEKCDLSAEDIKRVAEKTHGYVGADLAALCREGVMKTIARGLAKLERDDIEKALLEVRPSAMREIFLEMPKVRWDDIGGQDDLKQKLMEVVQLPLEAADTFKELGISAPKGVLLYGPPGCSKTLTAKALATELGLNFLAVKGPELFNKFVGESERAIREVFRKARAASPSIIFFDEIDAIASRDENTLAALNVLTSLLNEIDGVEELKGVVIVAATNRPTELDPALLRPGRLDRHIYVAPPDYDARMHIIRKRCAKFGADEGLYPHLASSTKGCSGAEVALLCQEAGMAAIMEDKEAKTVEKRHFDAALLEVSKGITKEMLDYFEAFKLGT